MTSQVLSMMLIFRAKIKVLRLVHFCIPARVWMADVVEINNDKITGILLKNGKAMFVVV